MHKKTILHYLEDTAPYRWFKLGLNRRLIQFLDKNVMNGRRGLVVGELACGSGYGANLIAQKMSVELSVAMDINAELFDQACNGGYKGTFIIGDIYKLPFANDGFDLVWNSSSVEHFCDPNVVIEIMTDAVKPGGYVFVGVPYLYGPLSIYHLVKNENIREWLGRPFNKKTLCKIFEQSGLEVTASLVYFFGFFVGILGRKIANEG